MSVLRLEIGDDQVPGRCCCCGGVSWTGHGFVYKDDEPFAVYYVGGSAAHSEHGVTMAIAVGEWDDEADARHRVCLGLEARESAATIDLCFIDGRESPWGNTALLGEMVSRERALVHPVKRDVLAVAELIVMEHPAVHRFLHSGARPLS